MSITGQPGTLGGTAVDADGLTSPWLSAALGRDARVLARTRIGTGQTAATYRLRIAADGLPPTVVAKVAAGDEVARRRVWNGYRAEVGFYADLAATVAVRAPACWYAAADREALRFTLLLEDLEPRQPGTQVAGCSARQALPAVRNLAGLHAPRWNDPSLFTLDYLKAPTPEGAAFLGNIAAAATRTFLDRFGAEVGAADAATLRDSAAAVEAWTLAGGEHTGLLHGDYRLDNLMFAPEGGAATGEVVAVDWQTLTVGPPARDVAYFLGTSLPVDARRGAEERLVGAYYDALVTAGVPGYPAGRCFDDYRLGQLQGPMITTIGAVYATARRTAAADEMFLTMARRSCAAIRDLRSLELL